MTQPGQGNTRGSERYAAYLRSPHWQETRDAKLASARFMCELCGEGGKRRYDHSGHEYWIGIHVHHLTYERLGAEHLDDLQVLCIHCHQVTHGRAVDNEWNRLQTRRRLAVGVVEYVPELDF